MKIKNIAILFLATIALGLSGCQNSPSTSSDSTSTTQVEDKSAISIIQEGKGTIETYPTDLSNVHINDTVVINPIADKGYYLTKIELDGERMNLDGGVYKFVVSKSTHEIKVIFTLIEANENDFTYEYNDESKTAVLAGYNVSGNLVPCPLVIPDETTYNNQTYKVTSIKENVFASTALTSIKLGKNIDTLNYGIFKDVLTLEEILVDENNPNYASLDGVLTSKDTKTLIAYPIDKTHGEMVLDSFTTIAPYAFANNRNITSLIVTDNVESIGDYAFSYMTFMKEITLPSTMSKTSEGMCYHCHSLETINFTSDIFEIGKLSFANCIEMKIIDLPDTVTIVDDYGFYDCTKVRKIILHEGLEEIGTSAFCRAKFVSEITLPSTIKRLGDHAFSEITELKTVTLNEGLEEIGEMAFSNSTYLRQINIPSSVKKIGANPFFGVASLAEIQIQNNNLFYFKNGGFYSAEDHKLISQLYSYTSNLFQLDEDVEIIGAYAFAYSNKIRKLVIPTSVIRFEAGPFMHSNNTMELQYLGTISQFSIIEQDADEPITFEAIFIDNQVACSDGPLPL